MSVRVRFRDALRRFVTPWLSDRPGEEKGKTVGFLQSIGCKGGKRPWSQSFTATNFPGAAGGTTSTQTRSGSANC